MDHKQVNSKGKHCVRKKACVWSARWPDPQGDLRLEASWEAFWIVHTTKWEHNDLAEYRAPERERMDKTELPGCGE